MKTDLGREYEVLRQAEAAAVELFLRAVSVAYQKPATAIRRMENYRSLNGQDALLQKLAVKPACFGRARCDPRPASSRRADSQLRRDAKDLKAATVLLPIFARDVFDARARRTDFEMQLSAVPRRFNDSSPNHTRHGESRLH